MFLVASKDGYPYLLRVTSDSTGSYICLEKSDPSSRNPKPHQGVLVFVLKVSQSDGLGDVLRAVPFIEPLRHMIASRHQAEVDKGDLPLDFQLLRSQANHEDVLEVSTHGPNHRSYTTAAR